VRLFFVVTFCLFSFGVCAQTAVQIDTIVVSGSAQIKKVSSFSSAPSTTITVPLTQAKTESVADILRRTAGVHIQRFGGLEQATTISIRGSSAAQVQILLDDVPMDTAGDQGIGLNQIASDGVSSIRVYKSSAPIEYGGGAIGGVVAIDTREAEPGFHGHAGLGFGSFSTLSGMAEGRYGAEKGKAVWGVDYRRTNGDFSFLDDNGTPLNPSDDARQARQNNAAQVLHPYFKLIKNLSGDGEVTLTNHLFRVDSGVPGVGSVLSQTAGLSLTDWLGSASWARRDYKNNKLAFKNTVYWRVIKSQFSDPAGEIGLGAAQDNDDDTLVLGEKFQARVICSKTLAIKSTAEYRFEIYRPEDYAAADPTGTQSLRQTLTVGIEPELTFGKLSVTPQVRLIHSKYDINDDDPSLAVRGTFVSQRAETKPAGNLAVRWHLREGLTLQGDFGRSVRQPKFSELFGDQGFVLGNPQLSSELAWQGAVGVDWKLALSRLVPEAHLDVSYFERHVDDLIQFELAGGFARAANIGKARVRGIESNVSFKLPKGFRLTQSYTYQSAIDLAVNPGNGLVGIPEHEWNGELSYKRGIFSAAVRSNLVDNQFLDALNTRRIDSRLLVDAEVAVFLRDRYRLALEGKNLSGSEVVDAVGFPLPGRSVFGRVDVYF
jgi:iron complex outermembrane receptor protein